MQLGIFARTFIRTSLGAVLDSVTVAGLRVVQFNLSCCGLATLPEVISPPLIAEISAELDQRGLKMAALSGTFNLIHPNHELRAAHLHRLPVLAQAASAWGCPLITLCTGTRDPDDMWRRHPDNDSSAAWDDLLKSVELALSLTETSGTILGFEPEQANVVNSATKARKLLDEFRSPRLKVVLDPTNLLAVQDEARQDKILRAAFSLLGSDIVLAHAKELAPSGSAGQLGPGQGVLDWDLYFRLLADVGFSGSLIMHGLPETDVARSLAFLLEKRDRATGRRATAKSTGI